MRYFNARLLALGAILLGITTPWSISAGTHSFTESFTTTQYKDTLNTTALWDTVTGKLMLHDFEFGIVGNKSLSSSAVDVEVSGDLAFVAIGAGGVKILDIGDLTNPTVLGTHTTLSAQKLFFDGNRLYIADLGGGLKIIDVSMPSSPTQIGMNPATTLVDVTVAGKYAYGALEFMANGAIYVYDINTLPAAPTVRDTTTAWGDIPKAIAADGDHVFLLCDDVFSGPCHEFQVWDVASPVNFDSVGGCNLPGTPRELAVCGDRAYVAADDGGLLVIDITNPSSPTLEQQYPMVGARAFDVAVTGVQCFVAAQNGELYVFRVRNTDLPVLRGAVATDGSARGVAVAADHAFVASGSQGLDIVEVFEPYSQMEIRNSDDHGDFVSVALSREYAYVGELNGEINVFDLSLEYFPAWQRVITASTLKVEDIEIEGNKLYAAQAEDGIVIFDSTNPQNPTHVATYNTPTYARGLDVVGNHAFVADEDALLILDCTDPSNVQLVGSCPVPSRAYDITVAGPYAYLACGGSNLHIANVSDLTSPGLVGFCDIVGAAVDVELAGDHIFVACSSGGLNILDGALTANPSRIAVFPTATLAQGVEVDGDYAYLATAGSGVLVVNAQDPSNPFLMGWCETPGNAYDLVLHGSDLFVVDGEHGMHSIPRLHRYCDAERTLARSLVIGEPRLDIAKTRVTSTQNDSIYWDLSANNGASWAPVMPDGQWRDIALSGSSLMWRSDHRYVERGVQPSCSELTIDWLYDPAVIDSVVDVPEDQGGWARVHFTRSAFDVMEETTQPIFGYNIHRRVDDAILRAAVIEKAQGRQMSLAEAASAVNLEKPFIVPPAEKLPVVQLGARHFVIHGPSNPLGAPPGVWEVVGTVFAQQEQQYIAVVPTIADSSATIVHSVYYVSAHTTTPSVFYNSPPDSGYSVDNVLPLPPGGFAAEYGLPEGTRLTWEPSEDGDFDHFNIYRGIVGSLPSPTGGPELKAEGEMDLVHSTTETDWLDPVYQGTMYIYELTAVDHSGNESVSSTTAPPGGNGGGWNERPKPKREPDGMNHGDNRVVHNIPHAFDVHQNVPNPFNPTTRIEYDVPAGGTPFSLEIYDVRGRLVRTLVKGTQTAGRRTIEWNGRDDRGESVASGIYFCRMTAPGFVRTNKMLLVR